MTSLLRHVLALTADDFERRNRVRYCRRCGRMIWAEPGAWSPRRHRWGMVGNRRPCREVGISVSLAPRSLRTLRYRLTRQELTTAHVAM